MGWFDNEQDGQQPNAAVPRSEPPRPVAKATPAAAPGSGSTLGCKIQVDGMIICDEDLTILGRVDGTIRAQGTLVIAKEAEVRAKIDGERVLVHGKVDGNVHGAERVVLGQTARLTGNIKATTLEITEGAYFKGNVEMQPVQPAKEPARASGDKLKAGEDGAKASGDRDKAGESSADDAATANVKPLAGPPVDETSATQEQATP